MSGVARPARPRRWLLSFSSGQTWSADQLALGALSSLGALVHLVALHRASGGFDPVFWLLVPLPLLLIRMNDSAVPLAYWGLMVFGWFHLTPAGSFSPWSVLGAAGLVLGHTCTTISAGAPPSAVLPSGTARHWLGRSIPAWGAAVVVAAGAGLLTGRVDDLGPLAQLVGLTGVVVGVWFLRSNPPENPA
jgi:hypothetical protein